MLLTSPGIDVQSAEPDWAVSKLLYSLRGKTSEEGYIIFTTRKDRPGAAIRCHSGKLFAAVSTEPLDIRYWMVQLTNSAKARDIRIGFGDGEMKEERWVAIYGGRMYMSGRISVSDPIFRTALLGGTVHFSKRSRQMLEIELPGGSAKLFNVFLQHCGLPELPLPGKARRSVVA